MKFMVSATTTLHSRLVLSPIANIEAHFISIKSALISISSNSFIHHMITLPAYSWPVNDFSCSDVVFSSQSKSIIIGLHSLQKNASLLSLESLGNQKRRKKKKVRERFLRVLDSYLHFEFCSVKNFHAQTNSLGL